MLDEVLNLFAAGLSERLRAAEIDGIGLYEFGIELMLADNLAETIANLWTGAVPVAIRVLRRKSLSRAWNRPDLLDRTDANAVGLSQGAIDGSRFGHAHLGTAYETRDVGGVGITISDKALALL
ncbi:MAG: hypothetical protein LAO22_23835 [Acidobacteriia bacterium]|nr:hypothetical protein [Terriglobia bacterium]